MRNIVQQILQEHAPKNYASPQQSTATAFAPSNIALCKYWGKRDTTLNLPYQSTISISLGDKGTTTSIEVIDNNHDEIIVNDQAIPLNTVFAKRITAYLDLFRQETSTKFKIMTRNSIPTAAGLASSASGFAALIKALNELYQWSLPDKELSILARLGSGSACRSLWHGFVHWQAGESDDGMDSFATPLVNSWDDLCVGLVLVSSEPKERSSREAMQASVQQRKHYQAWCKSVEHDCERIHEAIKNHDFHLLGETAERNAQSMHQLITKTNNGFSYHTQPTIKTINKIKALRKEGVPIYFTQDAGPNIKLLFLASSQQEVGEALANMFLIKV